MSVPKQDDVQAVLEDFHRRLREVIDRAWKEEWLDLPDRARFVFPRRVRAVLVFDGIARLALSEFDSDPNIRVMLQRQTVRFLFRDRVLVRFKKGNARGVGSNIGTQAELDFIDPQRSIPGLVPEIMRVEICYAPDDELGIVLSEVAVVARDRHRRVWAYPIDRGERKVVPLPPREPDHTPPMVVPRRRRRGEKFNSKTE
jgi:hypothetical protein